MPLSTTSCLPHSLMLACRQPNTTSRANKAFWDRLKLDQEGQVEGCSQVPVSQVWDLGQAPVGQQLPQVGGWGQVGQVQFGRQRLQVEGWGQVPWGQQQRLQVEGWGQVGQVPAGQDEGWDQLLQQPLVSPSQEGEQDAGATAAAVAAAAAAVGGGTAAAVAAAAGSVVAVVLPLTPCPFLQVQIAESVC
jgi:hypothetical protein